ncbi:MAG: hypothetical protein HY718_06215 [Planctomycetes bacterium]|nr:hypothetical protein [Planctomycetota bacterium]
MTGRAILLSLVVWIPAAGSAAPRLSLSNERLELTIGFALEGGGCRLHDRETDETYRAAEFGVVRVWDNTEDRMRTLLLAPEATTSTCRLDIERKGPAEAIVHVDTGPGSASPMGTMSFGVAFDVVLTLKDHALECAIRIAGLREQQAPPGVPQRWRLMNVELFPLLGATPAGSPGYLLIPSWSGAVYYFDRRHPRANPAYTKAGHGDLGTEAGLRSRWGFNPDAPDEYGSMVYGRQAVWEDQLQLPIYATIREHGGLMGILLGGEYDTELRARRHQGPQRTASINPVWHYRQYWHSKLDPVDRRVRLIAMDGKQAGYVGVGNLYREYLLNERGVKTLRERAATNPEVAYFMDSIYLRMMMGMKRASLDGKGEMRSFQTWDQFAEVVPRFRQAGFEKINFIFVGANFQGHDGAHPTVFPLKPAHGGEEGFRRMMRVLDAAGYRAGFHLNYKDCYRCSPDWNPAFVQTNEYGELRYHGAWIGGYSYQAIPQEMLERFGKRDLPRLRALGLRGMHYWDACLSVMEETFPPNRVIARREYGEGAIGYFDYAAQVFGTVGCETSIAPLLGIIVSAGNTSSPNGGASRQFNGSGYCGAALLDHWVPLQHIVYHGLCTYAAGPELAGRTGHEFNAAPTDQEIATIRRKYLESQAYNGPLAYEFIVNHERPSAGRTRTTLSDGTRILVNTTDQNWTDGDAVVKPKSHLIQRNGNR